MLPKSSMCSNHFVLNCKLCSEDNLAGMSTGVPNLPAEAVADLKVENPAFVAVPPIKPAITSPEAKKVLNVSEEYSISCETFSFISKQLSDAKELVKVLENKLADAKQHRAELKKKLLETLAMGEDNE